MTTMITLLIFIAVLAVLVLTHEFGHFVVARLSGMKVEEFGFGFPPRFFGIRRTKNTSNGTSKLHFVWGSKQVEEELAMSEHVPGTVYSINWLPLGGFVRIKGEDGSAANAHDADSFANKKPWQKAAVLVAGVGMNVLTAWVLFSAVLMIGSPQAVTTDQTSAVLENKRLEIMQILPGKPAELAGLKVGDGIISVAAVSANEIVRDPRVADLQSFVNNHKNDVLKITVERDGAQFVKEIQPAVDANGKAGIGVAIAEIGTAKYPWYQAIYYGGLTTLDALKQIFQGFGGLIVGLFRGSVNGAVAGPIGVAVATGQVARLGLVYLLQFMALLSLNLAVLNILPIPALDGGRLLFVIINKIKRSPVSPRAEQLAHTVGFFLLILLVIVVTVKDVSGIWGSWVTWAKNIL